MDKEQLEELKSALKKKVEEGQIDQKKANEELQKALDSQVETVEDLKSRVKTLESKKTVDLPGVDEEKENFMFSKAIYGKMTGDWSKAGFEKDRLLSQKNRGTVISRRTA